MARIPRRRRSMAKYRRSREERRRLSDGGGSAPHPPPTAEGPNAGFVPQAEMQKMTEKVIETAYQIAFKFDEDYENILVEQSFYRYEIENLLDRKSTVDDRLSKLKLTTKAPDSDNIKVIRSFTRMSMDLQESIDAAKMDLNEMSLMKTKLEARFRSSLSIIDQHVTMTKEDAEGDMLLGCLAYVLMMD